LKVDFGGGVKSKKEVEQLLELGINQINVGSLAVKKPEVFTGWMETYGPENFILSADVMDDNVMINGWLEATSLRLVDLADQFEKKGLEYICCTDIRTDGTLQGPNLSLYRKLKKRFPKLKVIASGGISSLNDLEELKYIKVDGAIIGKAIYENRIKLSELKNF
jgi:phosphoribosylformimino-5-aminoimidazole carboxamide ribotide isomerase